MLRPFLFPFIAMIPMFLGLGEIPIRLFVLFSSIVSVPLIYGIGKQFFDKKVALASAFILAVFWSYSFYSYRLLVDVPVAMLWIASIYFFFNAYFKNKSAKHFIFPGILLGLSFTMKFTAVMLFFTFAAYLLITERHKIINKKNIVFAIASFIPIIIYMISQYFSFGHPLAFLVRYQETSSMTKTFTQLFIDHTTHSLRLIHWVFIALFLIGLLIFLSYTFLLYKRVHIKKSTSNKYLFMLLWIVICLYFFARRDWSNYLDERYYFVFYPVVFLIAGKGISFIYDIAKKHNKKIAIILVAVILGFGAYQNITHANQIIDNKKDSYMQLKMAGEFINENTNPDDFLLILEEPAEITYYAPREYIHIGGGKNESFIIESIKEHKPKYAVLSFYIAGGAPDY
jgi:4-amino-4-deoxy-L-arabinose transferase-like glycosyltransferase